jgi:hypothetical protein
VYLGIYTSDSRQCPIFYSYRANTDYLFQNKFGSLRVKMKFLNLRDLAPVTMVAVHVSPCL